MMNEAPVHPPRELVSSFALELKRLAALVERSLRKGNDIVALSSLTALGPIMESLSETVLQQIVAESIDKKPKTLDGPSLNSGYL